jgi:hypothetical protein
MLIGRNISTLSLGWRFDADRAAGNGFRLLQFTLPGRLSYGSFISFNDRALFSILAACRGAFKKL